jgi:hypothetical protein
MKNWFLCILLIIFVLSCKQVNRVKNNSNSIKSEAMEVASGYVMARFKEPKKTVGSDGIITITEGQVNFITPVGEKLKFFITPSSIKTGFINDDQEEDATITINSFRGEYEETPETLILIGSNGKLVLTQAMESDMSILGIKDHIITAEVLTRSRNSPLRDCNKCKEVVKYRFRLGELIKTE